jgi:hypothetical protein
MTDLPNIPNLNGLVELGRREGLDIRPTLLRVMTDLYVRKPKHSADEERHFTELALRLIDLVDAPTRAIVAERIAAYPGAPAAVRQRLLRDSIETFVPVERNRSPGDPFGGGKVAADELNELFFAANPEERRLILLNLPFALLPQAGPVAEPVAREAIGRLEAAALAHNAETFARELEQALAISRTLARALIDDETGEPIVVAAVALGMPAAVLQRILLCLNPAISRSVQRVYQLAVLHEELEREAALRLVAIWQASHKAQNGKAARTASQPPRSRPFDPDQRATPDTRPKIRWDEHAQSRKSEGG